MVTESPLDDSLADADVLNALPSSAAMTADERLRVKVIRLKVILAASTNNALMGISATLLIALLIWYSAQSLYGQIVPWIWWLAYSAIALRIIQIAKIYERGAKSTSEVLSANRAFMLPILAAGCVWGSSAWLMLPMLDSRTESILIIGNAMVLMGVASGRGSDRLSLWLFMIPATGLFVSGLWRLADQFHLFLGLGFIIFTAGLLSFAKLQEQAVDTANHLRFETEKLLKERTTQQLETDRARREAEQAREQAELANQGKTTFLTAAGHDLRQPMHALVQYFGHLKRRNRDPLLDDTIGRIGKSLDSMQDLLDTILEVSKLMMGSVKPTLRNFEVSPLLDRLEAQLRPIAEDKGLTLSVLEEAAIVHTDEVMLERILRNLTLNAIRYTDRGQVVVRAKCRGQRLIFQVFDTGIGIKKAEREKIFEAFYQVGNEARDRRRGLGLGLAIVRQLSELLDIKVVVRSRQGRCSLFRIELPTTFGHIKVPRACITEHRQDFASGAFVVLIDDNEESLEATSASLKEFGCRVLSARSGMHAIERLQGQEFMPQLVISDYRLEGETGLDAIKMVVENQQALYGDELGIGAFVISGDTAPAEMQHVLNAGYRMLHKPVRLDALYDAVNAQLETLARGAIEK